MLNLHIVVTIYTSFSGDPHAYRRIFQPAYIVTMYIGTCEKYANAWYQEPKPCLEKAFKYLLYNIYRYSNPWRIFQDIIDHPFNPKRHGSNVSATPIGQTGLEMGWFPLGNGVCLIMKKAPSDSPIWQLKMRELLLPLSFLFTKPLKLDLSNLHYGPHYKPHYRTQGCVIRENNITIPLWTPLRTR